MKTRVSAMIGTASLIALAAPATAQDASTTQTSSPAADSITPQGVPAITEQQTSDIVVTAQRRQERVVEVPISITVASQAQLERQQVNTVNDLSRISPSLEIQQAPGQNTGGGGSLRGLGTQTFSAGAVASVGIVVDQVSQGNANISDLFDVGRIEVLKGPQGTLFGLTTSAGVINITTNAPDPSGFSARVRTELSDAGTAGSRFGNQIVQGVVNVPISADAAIRVAGFGNLRQGPNRNAIAGKLNDTDRYGGRARLLWRAGDRLTFNLIGDYSQTKTRNGGDFFTFVKSGGPGLIFGAVPDTRGITARLASCGVTPREGNQDYCTSQNYTGRFKSYGGSFQADYEAEPFTLTSISAYREAKETGSGSATNVFRADPLELQVGNGAVNRRTSLFTQEFRISSPANQLLEYTVGTFFSRQIQNRNPESLSVSIVPAPSVVIPIARSLGAFDHILDESLSVFGQGTLHLTSKARLIAGGRYTSAKLALNRTSLDSPAAPFYSQELSTGKISYRFGGQYDLTNRMMIYATASRGFKGGQIATPALPAVPYVVRPEIPTAYEAGLKTTVFGSWVVDLNVYYTKIKDFQAQSCTTDPATAAISCVQNNIDGVKSRGAEINLFGRVTHDLSINTGFIVAKATYPGGYVGTDGSNIGGSQLAYAPKYKFTFSGEYEHLVASGFKGFLAADTVWKSRIRYEANALAETTYRAHWTAGGRLGVRTEDNRYQIAIFARNLFNQHEPQLLQSTFPYDGATNVGAIYGPQSYRQIGVSLDGKF